MLTLEECGDHESEVEVKSDIIQAGLTKQAEPQQIHNNPIDTVRTKQHIRTLKD